VTVRAGARLVIALAAMVAAAGAGSLSRPGYSPDEEFTLFAVRGIATHGLPLLPSGLLYDRGLLYSYPSWAAARLTGLELPAFRALSLVCGAVTLVLGFALVRRLASPAAGVLSVTLVSTCLPFWAVATTGRFYAAFLLACVAISWRLAAPVRRWAPIAALAFVSRLVHELAFVLLAIPAAALVLTWTDQPAAPATRRHWLRVGMLILVGLGAAQALVMAIHFLMPPSDGGGTMIRRFFVWQVLNLFERPAGAPLGFTCAAVVAGVLVAPRAARRIVRIGTLVAILVVISTLALGMGSTTAITAALGRSVTYPLDMFWHLVAAHPVMVWTGLTLLAGRLCGAGGEWPARERAAHLGWVAWVLWFGVIESGITINYVLLPTVCLLAAIGLDLVAIGEHSAAIWPGRRAQVIRAALAGVALAVIADQWSGTGPLPQRLAAERPTIDVPRLEAIRADLRPDDRVACTDELACLLLVGRVDAWLALDDYVRERFIVTRGQERVGVYAGAPARLRLADLFAPDRAGRMPARVLVVDVFKDYPVGNSRTWLPRALAADGLAAEPWLLTPQARVVRLVPAPMRMQSDSSAATSAAPARNASVPLQPRAAAIRGTSQIENTPPGFLINFSTPAAAHGVAPPMPVAVVKSALRHLCRAADGRRYPSMAMIAPARSRCSARTQRATRATPRPPPWGVTRARVGQATGSAQRPIRRVRSRRTARSAVPARRRRSPRPGPASRDAAA
jgi:hypothetical protein